MTFKKITTNKVVYSIIAFSIGLFFFGYNSVNAATIQINSNSVSLSPGGIATLSVVLNSESVAINNADAKIMFPADLLEVVSVSRVGSIFSLWVEEPDYSNVSGTITFNGGIPAPGFTGSSGTVISVVIKAKKAGQANLTFSDAAVRANDGLGTDVLRAKTGKTISIIEKEQPIIKETPTPAPVLAPESTPSVVSLQVTSPTHPSQESWYTDNSPIFRWKVPTGVTAVQTGIDDNTSGSPRVTYSPAISEKTVKDLKDGVWYFKVRARKDGEWGQTSTYIARIDNTIPKKNNVVFSYDDDKKVLDIDADIIDETSGLDYYKLYINGAFVKKVPAEDFVNGKYSIAVKTSGDNTIKLVAVDRAGNSVESSGDFKSMAVKAEEEPVQPATTKDQLLITIGSFSIPAVYAIVITLLIVIILILSAFILGLHYSKLRNKIKVRPVLVNGDNTEALLLFRKRLEKYLKVLQRTRHTRILSKEEKGIKEAIERDLDEIDRALEEQREEIS